MPRERLQGARVPQDGARQRNVLKNAQDAYALEAARLQHVQVDVILNQ